MAEAVGKSRPHVANVLRLLNLPETVRGHVLQGQLSAGHARALVSAEDPSALARQVIDQGLNVRETEALVKRRADAKDKAFRIPPVPAGKDADTVALESDLAEALGLKVEILDKNGAGEVRVKYATLEQLDELVRRLGRA